MLKVEESVSASNSRPPSHFAKKIPVVKKIENERTGPYFVSGFEVDQACNNNLQKYLMSLNPHGSEDVVELDLLALKKLIRQSHYLYIFGAREKEFEEFAFNCLQEVQKKYYVLFLKLCSISIDGYKRDRYMLKIEDMTAKVEQA